MIYPPVETSKFQPACPEEVGNHFLVVSRLLSYKRIDLAVSACTRLGLPLRVVGIGPDMVHLKRIAGPTIQFLGRLSDKQVARELSVCKALIFPGEEDFGITPVECMASGRPVIAYGAGGALETVVENETGLFFAEQTVESLVCALKEFDHCVFQTEILQAQAARFDTSVFEKQLLALIGEAMEEHRNNNSMAYINHKSLSSDKKPAAAFASKTLTESFKAEHYAALHRNAGNIGT